MTVRTKDGKPKPSGFWISPTAIVRGAACLHAWHLDCFGDKSLRREPDEGTRLMFERGKEEEVRKARSLPGLVELDWDSNDWTEGHRRSVELMKTGPAWIYQSAFVEGDCRGRPDLLRRVERPSRLGTFSYEPVDIKGHKEVEVSDRLQLQGYSLLLENVLGYRPERGAIWLNTGKIEDVDLVRTWDEFTDILEAMRRVTRKEEATHGLRCGECKTCAWLDVCSGQWKTEDDVCLVYGATKGVAQKLRKTGFPTWKAVASVDLPTFLKRSSLKDDTARKVWTQAQAWAAGGPKRMEPAEFPDDRPRLFYDVETYEKTVYLHGVIRVHGDSREERQWVAEDLADEERVWREFIEYLSRDKSAVVYCWSSYEFGTTETLMGRYRVDSPGLKLLTESMTDQCAWVRDRFALPVSSYSIKKVAPAFGFKWDAEDAGGLNSESWYKTWLEKRDRELLKKLVRYNLDDVRAMVAIDDALRAWCLANPEREGGK